MTRKVVVSLFFFLLVTATISAVAQVELPKGISFASLLRIGPEKIENLKVGDSSPNELPGFEFFRRGKLNGLRLGISTKADVTKILGHACDEVCNLDDKWRLLLNYYPAQSNQTLESQTGSVKTTMEVKAKPEFVDRIESLVLIPKTDVHLRSSAFNDEFYRGNSVIMSDGFSINGKAAKSSVLTTVEYMDGYGLQYSLDEKEPLKAPTTARPKTGKLRRITYQIPNYLEEQELYIYTPIPNRPER